MKDSAGVETYARVLFELASLSDTVSKAAEDIESVAAAVRGHMDLRDALAEPGIPAEKKREVLREIFGSGVDPAVLSIITLMAETGRAGSLDALSRRFQELSDTERGIVTAEVVTAVPLDDAMRGKVRENVSAAVGRPVELREHVDGSVVGGIVIKVAGRVFDGSLASQLSVVRQVLGAGATGGGVQVG